MESFLVAVNAVIPFFCYLALGYTMKIKYSMEMNGQYAFDCSTEILASSKKDEVLGIVAKD